MSIRTALSQSCRRLPKRPVTGGQTAYDPAMWTNVDDAKVSKARECSHGDIRSASSINKNPHPHMELRHADDKSVMELHARNTSGSLRLRRRSNTALPFLQEWSFIGTCTKRRIAARRGPSRVDS
jgi:hypothetical protein